MGGGVPRWHEGWGWAGWHGTWVAGVPKGHGNNYWGGAPLKREGWAGAGRTACTDMLFTRTVKIWNPGEQLQRLIGGMGPIAYLLITQEGDLKPKPPAGWGSLVLTNRASRLTGERVATLPPRAGWWFLW